MLFDFDGTLADSFPWFLGVINDVARKYRFRTVASHEVDALRGLSSRQVLRFLGIPWWKVPLIARHLRALAGEETGAVHPFAGVPEMLQNLSQSGIRIGVVTSNSRPKVERVLGQRSASLISEYECNVGMFAKRRALKRALTRFGVPASQTLYIGDETRDAEAARSLGIAFGGVAWGFGKPETLREHGAWRIFQSVPEIEQAARNALSS